MARNTALYAFAVLAVLVLPTYARSTKQFKHWYPQYRDYLTEVVSDNCTVEYDWYLSHSGHNECTWQGRWCSTNPIISCILSTIDNAVQAQMAAAAVVLGLLPTVLALVGCSPVEIGLLALRRPVLSFLLCVASPSPALIRSNEYKKPVKEIFEQEDEVEPEAPSKLSPLHGYVISAIQYLAALAMLANLFELAWELMLRVVFAAVSERIDLPYWYILAASIIHIMGALAVRLHYRTHDTTQQDQSTFTTWLLRELRPCVNQAPWSIQPRRTSWIFHVTAWFASLCTLIFIVLGTFMFSSALFVAQQDALVIAARFLINMLIARVIIAWELKGMGQVVTIRPQTWRVDQDTTYLEVSTKAS